MNPQPPTPALWAPRLRARLTRFFAWMDHRKARHISRVWLDQQDAHWRQNYTAWWMEHGWQDGADNPDVAWLKLQSSRR